MTCGHRGWVLLLAAVCGCSPAPELDDPGGCTELQASPELSEASLQVHMAALADAATVHGGNRAAGSPGYNASADYAQEVLEDAGYEVTRDEFTFQKFEILAPPVLSQVAPEQASYTLWKDFVLWRFIPAGKVTAQVTPVDVNLIDLQSTSACEAEDFVGFPSGHIALVRRGTCPHETKARFAQQAGAVGVLEFGDDDRLFDSRFSSTTDVEIPLLYVTRTLGVDLLERSLAGDLVMTMDVQTSSTEATTFNVIADLPGSDPEAPVVMLGGHLDSVHHGPGLNDNGSGSVATLATARALASTCTANNRLRVALWGAEEYGLLGSVHYIDSLSPQARQEIALYLNFDMVGSPNFARQIYDGDGSHTPDAGPPGSDIIEDAFIEFFHDRKLMVEPTAFSGRSDYGPFIAAGIPAGGLFTGASATKSPEQQLAYGGEMGLALDPCYHAPCDDWANLDWQVLTQMTQAAAAVTEKFATSVDSLPTRVAVDLKASVGHQVSHGHDGLACGDDNRW